MDQEKIGKFIAELRKENNWTQEDLAQKLIVDRGTISKWERGVYIPNPEMLLKLHELFNVSINELFYGERKNTDNEQKIDNITVEVIKDTKKKIKKTLFSSVLVIVLLVVLFLVYYFINNYNSISVYRIFGENENYTINDGLLIVSKEKSYIKLGNIEKYDKDNEIKSIRLFYKKNDKEYDIFTGIEDYSNYLLINNFDYNELYNYDDLKYIKNNLFLEVKDSKETLEIIKLKLEKDFSNDSLFEDKKKSIFDVNETFESVDNIPKYIKENFEFNNKENYYDSEIKTDSLTIYEKYLVESQLYMVTKEQNDSKEHFEYYLTHDNLSYYTIENGIVTNYFFYNLSNNVCESGYCDVSVIDDFKKLYLNKINYKN